MSAAARSRSTATFRTEAERSLTRPSIASRRLSPMSADSTVDSTLKPSTASFSGGSATIFDARRARVFESKTLLYKAALSSLLSPHLDVTRSRETFLS